MSTSISGIRLNEQQLMMLQLLREPMPDEQFDKLRDMVVQLLAKRIEDLSEKWEKENNITEEYYDNLSKEHFRTPYTKEG